jgi:large subunit ribosomal protein L21
MYAVIATGGKQERVEVGQRVEVELIDAPAGEEVSLRPLLVVDDDGATVLAGRPALAGVSVTARVLGVVKGPKVVGFTYRPKARRRRRFGHRQRYTVLEILGIGAAAAGREAASAVGTGSDTDSEGKE